MWSIVQGGIVVAYAERLYLKDVKFQVREAGRERVRREKMKNVHAFVIGHLCDVAEIRLLEERHLEGENDVLPYFGVSYNPYTDETFINEDREEAIHTAPYVDMDMDSEMKVMAVFTPEQMAIEWPSKTIGA